MTPEPTIVEPPVEFEPADSAATLESATPPAAPGTADDQVADNGSLPLLLAFIGLMIAIGFGRSWWIPGIIAGLLFMLFMHELGHYLTARASGMKVTEFFLGFGPKIWSFNKGETEYGLKGIPAGAYVRIIGMTNLEEIDPAEEHRTYRAQPYWQRMMTICAGSAMHFLMALVCGAVLFTSYQYQGFNGAPWQVDLVVEGSTADRIGVEVGDTVKTFDGRDFATWVEFGDVVTSTPLGVPIDVVVDRDGQELTLTGEIGPRSQDVILDGFGLIMIEENADVGWEVSYLYPGDNAEEFGLEVGDVFVQAGEVTRPSQFTLANALIDSSGESIAVEVLRDGESVVLEGPVELNSSPPFRGFLGIGPVSVPLDEPGPLSSVGLAVQDFGTVSKTNIRGIIDLISPGTWFGDGEQSIERRAAALPRNATVPVPVVETEVDSGNRPISIIGIGRLIAESESVDQVLFLFMMVNVFIGLFNLAPLLPLDGGHAAIATYERVRGLVTRTPHRVDATKLLPFTWVVIILLVALGLWTAVLDIFSWPV